MSKKAKRIISVLLVLAIVATLLIILFACGTANVYELGPYSITEDEYAYLLSSYKRTIIDGLGISEDYLDYPIDSSSSTTYGEYIEKMYREEFEQSVYTLLFSLALFDEYGLEFTEEDEEAIEKAAKSVIVYYGDGSPARFDELARPCGFTNETIYSIYEKREKEKAVIHHVLGVNYSNLTETQKDNHYKDNYIHFQVLVVNTLYTQNADGTFSNLSESERATMIELEKELTNLLCHEKTDADYKILSALLKKDIIIENEKGEKVINVTFEELWANERINDDSVYPNGYYMTKPSIYQMSYSNTLSQAMLTKEGDVSVSVAKRFFDGSGSITTENGEETIKKGDYFEYGSAFVKRLPMQDMAWKDPVNKDFFTDDSFLTGAAQSALFDTLQKYEKTCGYTLVSDTALLEEYSFSSVTANYVDYDYLNPSDEEDK